MAISPTNQEFIIRLLADFTADTLAELDADLATYVDQYVHVLENDKIYRIENIGGTPTRCEAADYNSYVTSPADLATETTLSSLVQYVDELESKLQTLIDSDAYDDLNDRIKVDLEASGLIGEVDDNPTPNTVLARLKCICDALEAGAGGGGTHGSDPSDPTYVQVIPEPINTTTDVESGVDGVVNIPEGARVELLTASAPFDAEATITIEGKNPIFIKPGRNFGDDISDVAEGPFTVTFTGTEEYYMKVVLVDPIINQPSITSPADGDTDVEL